MSFQDVGRRMNCSFNNHHDILEMSRPINEDEPSIIVPREQRGVRPRLETRCPVTSKALLDDISMVDSFVTQPSRGDSPTPEEEDPIIPPVTPSPLSSRSLSIYSYLTTAIVNFQKMVTELESLLEISGHYPEAQWRTRILIRSAQDADRDISKRLYEYESSFGEDTSCSRAQIASRKLHRDFRRVHKQLHATLEAYEKLQQVEVSFLSSREEKKEDFFDRAMRERDAEVNNIHKSMQKVNEIYTDLAALVDVQQEQIDKVAETTEYSKSNTRAGLEQIQQSVLGLCGPVSDSEQPTSVQPKEGELRVGEEFKWSMPFETISDDMRAVHQDVVKFGRNLMEDLQENVQNQITENPGGLGCAPIVFDCQDMGAERTADTIVS